MDITEIQSRLDAMPARMLAKGLVMPTASARIEANTELAVYLRWEDMTKPKSAYRTVIEAFRRDDISAALDAADAYISGMPSAEETKLRNFMDALGNVIDLGRSQGIEVDFVNPLVETMKRLSENVITYQTDAALSKAGAAS